MIKLGEVPSECESKSFDMFTGAIVYEVIAVNPTLKELEAAGITWMKQEPNYIRDFGDSKAAEILFYLKAVNEEQNHQIVPLKFLLSFEDKPAGTNSGKTQYIDSTGRTTWALDQSSLVKGDWFTNIDSRPIKKNEEELYRFVNRWLNLNGKIDDPQDIVFDINKIMRGDFSELKDLFYKNVIPQQEKVGRSYSAYVLTGVNQRENDGKVYNNVMAYNKQFYSSVWGSEFVEGKFADYIAKSTYNSFGTDNNPVIYSIGVTKFDPNAVVPDTDGGSEDSSETTTEADPLPF